MRSKIALLLIPILAVFSLVAVSCGSDDGGSVRDLDSSSSSASSGSASGSASASTPASSSSSGSASASGSAPTVAGGPTDDATAGDGGYDYASNIDSHRLVVADICEINTLLGEYDWEAAMEIYQNGKNSVKSSGDVRTIGGFAVAEGKKHGVDTYYGTAAPMDEFVLAALNGTGPFKSESDAVRKQGAQKGIMNQIMVAWVVHELGSSSGKAADGNFDSASGAPHNWDEAWAFYHGAEPGCGPFATANKRGADFGTVGADGETALANEAILAAMIEGRDALYAGDTAGVDAAAAEVTKQAVIIYSQATIKYATKVLSDIADGDAAAARTHQSEGYAFWRVIEPYIGGVADSDAINAILHLENEAGSGGGDDIRAALQPAWDALGIEAADVGTYG